MWIWWFLGAIVILLLGSVALHLHWRLHQLRQTQARGHATMEQGRAQRFHSIEIICRALLAQQVQPAEAAVRVAGLLNQLQVDADARAAFDAFDEMDRALAHIPRLNGWSELDSAARRRYQRDIDAAEARLAVSMRLAAERILAMGVAHSISAGWQAPSS